MWSEICWKCFWNDVDCNFENLTFLFFFQMALSWGLKRLLASPATDLLVCIFFHLFCSLDSLLHAPLTFSRLDQIRKEEKSNEKQWIFWYLQVWAGWLVLVTASLLLPIYLAASLLAARHCTPQHSIVLPIGHFSKIYMDGQILFLLDIDKYCR